MKAHGVRGEVIVAPITDDPGRFAPGNTVLIGRSPEATSPISVTASRPHQSRLIVTFDGPTDRDGADRLRGSLLFVPAEERKPLPDGEDVWWEVDLIGSAVQDSEGNKLGVLTQVLTGAAQDLWVVDTGSTEVLVPAVSQFVVKVDIEAKLIVLSPPEGLFEA